MGTEKLFKIRNVKKKVSSLNIHNYDYLHTFIYMYRLSKLLINIKGSIIEMTMF